MKIQVATKNKRQCQFNLELKKKTIFLETFDNRRLRTCEKVARWWI